MTHYMGVDGLCACGLEAPLVFTTHRERVTCSVCLRILSKIPDRRDTAAVEAWLDA